MTDVVAWDPYDVEACGTEVDAWAALREQVLSQVDDGYERSTLPERVKTNLRLADRSPASAPPRTGQHARRQRGRRPPAVDGQVRAASRVLLTLGIEDEPEERRIREVAGRS